MRITNAALTAHLEQNVRTLATCWLIELSDGTIEAYTSHDTDLTFAGHTFVKQGISQTNTTSKITIETDNLELHGLLEPESSFATVNSRKYDDARVRVFEVNYMDLPSEITATSVLWVKTGILGDAFYEKGKWILEARGFKQLLKQTTGNKTTRLCRAEFGDHNCRADLTQFSKTGVVQTFTDRSIVTNISGLTSNEAKQGKIEFTESGIAYDVSGSSGGTFVLTEEIDFNPVGLEVLVTFGCNKWLDDCNKYNNIENFYGEPFIPTEDEWAAGYFTTIVG